MQTNKTRLFEILATGDRTKGVYCVKSEIVYIGEFKFIIRVLNYTIQVYCTTKSTGLGEVVLGIDQTSIYTIALGDYSPQIKDRMRRCLNNWLNEEV